MRLALLGLQLPTRGCSGRLLELWIIWQMFKSEPTGQFADAGMPIFSNFTCDVARPVAGFSRLRNAAFRAAKGALAWFSSELGLSPGATLGNDQHHLAGGGQAGSFRCHPMPRRRQLVPSGHRITRIRAVAYI
jgi:hypothetical protein